MTVSGFSVFALSGWRRLGVVMVVCLWPLGAATAADPLDKLDRGPRVGTSIPHSLSALDQFGENQSFSSLRGKRGLVLLFNRSFDW